jgi:hypothetical protein
MAAVSDDLGMEWYRYVGSNIETTREFCEHLTQKEYIHKSEIQTILTGMIDGHQCDIYEPTGLPYGMVAGTNEDNFREYRGGWNCGHQLIPVSEGSVPQAIRDKLKYPQKEGIIKKTYKTEQEVVSSFRQINDKLPNGEKWFSHGFHSLEVETSAGNNGSTNGAGKIYLQTERLENVKKALSKIGNGQSDKISEAEADAMATSLKAP